ncbi:HTH-type transcriptional activator IlvY [Rodentibacter pneumotropicus]|uniref:HTH-type transcriptional activator IlvY n=1 Tax=Rodentibacter pneumotropicus TaxID=758 RepID=UPI000476009D|nr:HTH-type transcriptional activator IlvY [Rodentibacter pneumotropicus]NBH75844.1 HTH-type transcriptional activator IlvY [Rodentibacter pneumotropicus]OOF60661.1 transcriptional regulator IlvY [Rodentibacter pneumotropicus]OOF62437.1 transcriptional regulator IlvY [Rodentibacter pneumotropicus]THA00134.1 HTH-type transcriptional activator IlvY [Rodentibacter pneumotropicus]THA03534.1 HTH-type transcriptional activator IlvY [Rodentibacter pneumotropicus]
MDFTDLNLFIKLAETKNFAKTATQNHMSPSTLSRQIQRMEEELGKILFIRDNRQVNLTEYGEMFLQFAKAEWQNWQQFKQQLNDELDELSGELKLFCSVTASYSHLPQVLKQFRQRYPKVEIQLTTGDPALALELVQSQQADIALAGKPNNLPASVVFHKIDDIHLSLIAPRVACLATQLLQEKPINWQQMPFIFPVEGQARQRIEQWLREKQIKHPKIYATVAGHEGIVPMVGLGFGLAMLPDAVIDNSPMRDQISHLNLDVPVAPFELGIYTQKRNLVQPLIRAFWAMLE